MARIELERVSKTWGPAVAVADMSLTIEQGEFVAILGPSGCGKSTTLFMLAGIYMPTDGEIRFDGARVNEVEARDRNVGIVFQSYALYPNMTVLQNIMFPLRFKGIDKAKAAEEARAIADLVHIGPLLERRPAQLSGGQQQRVALARALVKRPNLLLLDEPLSNLDATLRLSMRHEIRRLQRELGVTAILVTHDQIEAMTMADRIVCMSAGQIEQSGPPGDLYALPRTEFVARFIGAPPINMLDGTVDGGRLLLADSTAYRVNGGTPDGPVRFAIRPEHVRAANGNTDGAPVAGPVTAIEALGRETLYQVETGAGPIRFLEPTAVPRLAPGDPVALRFDAAHALLFDPATGLRLDGATCHD